MPLTTQQTVPAGRGDIDHPSTKLQQEEKKHMKGFKRALLAAAIAAPVAAWAAPKVAIEAPESNSIQSGITQIYGWASDVEPIVKVELYVDGQEGQTMVLGSGGERADVAASYPNDYDPLHSGFATAFHTKLLSNGPHTITIEAKNQSGEETKVSTTIIVSNAPETTVNNDSIDISNATARISGNHIFLDGVVVNGVVYNNFELAFDDVINGFRIIGFRDDLNGDGISDDDSDGDGFRDDDSDKDGFSDDDDDKDGLDDDLDDDDSVDGPDDSDDDSLDDLDDDSTDDSGDDSLDDLNDDNGCDTPDDASDDD